MKNWILSIIGAVGSTISYLFGGWDTALVTMVIFMGLDYVTGIIVAGVFKKSGKSETGALESRAGFKGLCRKGIMLTLVLVASQLDLIIGSDFVRDGVIIAFVANEALSITENAGLMGVPVPTIVKKALEALKKEDKIE